MEEGRGKVTERMGGRDGTGQGMGRGGEGKEKEEGGREERGYSPKLQFLAQTVTDLDSTTSHYSRLQKLCVHVGVTVK